MSEPEVLWEGTLPGEHLPVKLIAGRESYGPEVLRRSSSSANWWPTGGRGLTSDHLAAHLARELRALREAARAVVEVRGGYPSGAEWRVLNNAISRLAALLPAAEATP